MSRQRIGTSKTWGLEGKISHIGKKRMILWILLFSVIWTIGCSGSGGKTVETVSLGTWVETKQISERDEKLYPMKYRITRVDRDQNSVNKRIEEYNASARGNTIQPLSQGNLEYAIADYEAFYPEDFPDEEFGITKVAVSFSIAGLDGKSEVVVDDTVYKGIGKTWEIGQSPMGYDFYGGYTYKGSILFVMVQGSDAYVFKEEYEEKGEKESHYIKGE